MKIFKLILPVLFAFALFSMSASAQTVINGQISTDKEAEKVNLIGHKLLDANRIPAKVTFYVSDKEDVNAYANIDNEIYVYSGLLKLVQTDDELAAVISHEIGHIANKHMQKQTVLGVITQSISSKIASIARKPFISKIADGIGVLSLLKVSRSSEYEADLTGVDLMIGANYNPLGMISLLNKISQNYIDIVYSHPSGNKRLENVYDYLSFNYPDRIKKDYNTDSYKNFKIYIDEVIKERNSNPKKLAEYTKKQSKLRAERLKIAKSVKQDTNGWEASYNILKSTVQPSGQ